MGFRRCGCGKLYFSGWLIVFNSDVVEGRTLYSSVIAAVKGITLPIFSHPLFRFGSYLAGRDILLVSTVAAAFLLSFRRYKSDARLFVTQLFPPLRMDLWFGLPSLQKEIHFCLPIQMFLTSELLNFPHHTCRLYIDGVGIVGLSYYSTRFSIVAVPAVKIVAVTRLHLPSPPCSVHAVQVSQP